MKLWTVIVNDQYGPSVEIYRTQVEANEAAWDFADTFWQEEKGGDTPEDWEDAMEILWEQPLFIDSVHMDCHEVIPPEPERNLIEDILAASVPDLRDGDLEVDENMAVVSLGEDPGAYVQCWKWVDFEDVDQDMALIPPDGPVWYFDLFSEFMMAYAEAPEGTIMKRGTPELLEQSGGMIHDAEEFIHWMEAKA